MNSPTVDVRGARHAAGPEAVGAFTIPRLASPQELESSAVWPRTGHGSAPEGFQSLTSAGSLPPRNMRLKVHYRDGRTRTVDSRRYLERERLIPLWSVLAILAIIVFGFGYYLR